MISLRNALLASMLVSSIAHAEREGPPRPDRGMKMFREGTAVFNREISPYFDLLTEQCVGDPSQKWLERLAALDTKVAAVSKPDDKKQLVEYMAVLRPWVESKIRDVPGVGTWADAKAAVEGKIALAKLAPPTPGPSDAELKAMVAYSGKVRAVSSKSNKALSYAQNKIFGCEEFLGKPGDLHAGFQLLDENMQTIEAALTARARDLAKTKYDPFRNALSGLAEVKSQKTWDEQVKLVSAAFDALAMAQDLIANEEMYLALDSYDSAQYGAGDAVPAAKKHVAEYGPKIAKLVEDVSFPSNTSKDPVRDAIANQWLAGRKVLNGPLNWGSVSKQSLTETEHGRIYPVLRETATAYFVVKPATWTRPIPDGIAAEDLCELGYFYHGRFTAGPPSYKPRLNKWSSVPNERFIAPIMCKNAKRVSKLN